jgi:hypothetical protein
MPRFQKLFPSLFIIYTVLFFFTRFQINDDLSVFLPLIPVDIPGQSTDLIINQIFDNRTEYPSDQIPAFEKFEITFQVENSIAQNKQFPYDPSPPPGIDLNNPNYQGITVNALFTPDNWQTIYAQPAFYYQDFLDQVYDNQNWYYPTANFSWKVRFAPDRSGIWQYKLTARDASGSVESFPVSFIVVPSQNPGLIQTSESDPRYFEFDNGDYFSGLGYNLNYNQVDWANPIINNQANFKTMSENGIQKIRIWLSQWGIYGSAWNPWNSPDPDKHGLYIPIPGLAYWESYLDNEVSMMLSTGSDWFSPCMFIGAWKAKPAVKSGSDYRVHIRFKINELKGPRDSNHPSGFVAKTGGWLWNDEYCYDPGTGDVVAATYPGNNWQAYPDQQDPSWTILEGTLNTGNNNYLPNFYLALENVTSGIVYVDHVSIEEILKDGQYGPNIVSKPLMAHHLYFEQRNSYAFDKLLDLAKSYGIYIRPVILEKNEWISNQIGANGTFTEESVNNFYGEWRKETKGRWLQKAWWRYLQARWGYSTQIHSWELLNEGDPANTRHYALADEFGIFMNCEVFGIQVENQNGAKCVFHHPNGHLVSSSFWHSFPAKEFWGNLDYRNMDYADVHAYVSTGWLDDPQHEIDASAYHIDYGRNVREWLDSQFVEEPTMPIIRGEAGIDFVDEQREQPDLEKDDYGVWLHNYIWASLDGNALIEEYWWTRNINMLPGPDGIPGLHEVFRYFFAFIDDIPLNNGNYQNINSAASNSQMQIYGQKDVVNNRAHFWVKNRDHTWRNVVDGASGISGLSGKVTIEGFTPNSQLTLEWHVFATEGLPSISHSTVTADSNGVIVLTLPTDPHITDVGIKLGY